MADPTPPTVVVTQEVPPDDKSKTHWILPDIPKSYVNWAIGIAAFILILSGKLQWSDVKGYADYWFQGQSSTTTETKIVKKTGEDPPKIDQPAVASAPSASITPEQIQQWIDLFKPIIQEIVTDLKKPPVVTPPVNPPVVVTPPIVVNPPVNPPVVVTPPAPDPSATLKLVLTDELSKPVTSMTVDIEQIIQVTLSGAKGTVVWNVTTVGNVSHPALPQNLGYSIELRDAASWVSIHAVDLGSGQSVSARITANLGGQPPPVNPPVVNPPVVVTPPVNPPVPNVPPGSKKFSLAIVEDPAAIRSVTTMSIMNNLKARKELTDKGHVVTATVPSTGNDPSAVYAKQQKTPLPALVIQDAATHQFVGSVPLPTDFGLSVLAGIGG